MRKDFLFLPFLLLGCAQSPVSSSESSLEESSSSSLESSVPVEVPEKIYLYDEGNVPYDGEESAREYAFLTPYLSSSPTGGRRMVGRTTMAIKKKPARSPLFITKRAFPYSF